MAFTLNEGQGTLFKNDKKGNDKAPDYRGELMIGETLHKVAGWLKEGKSGKWMSLKVEPKDGDSMRETVSTRTREAPADDIPFN